MNTTFKTIKVYVLMLGFSGFIISCGSPEVRYEKVAVNTDQEEATLNPDLQGDFEQLNHTLKLLEEEESYLSEQELTLNNDGSATIAQGGGDHGLELAGVRKSLREVKKIKDMIATVSSSAKRGAKAANKVTATYQEPQSAALTAGETLASRFCNLNAFDSFKAALATSPQGIDIEQISDSDFYKICDKTTAAMETEQSKLALTGDFGPMIATMLFAITNEGMVLVGNVSSILGAMGFLIKTTVECAAPLKLKAFNSCMQSRLVEVDASGDRVMPDFVKFSFAEIVKFPNVPAISNNVRLAAVAAFGAISDPITMSVGACGGAGAALLSPAGGMAGVVGGCAGSAFAGAYTGATAASWGAAW